MLNCKLTHQIDCECTMCVLFGQSDTPSIPTHDPTDAEEMHAVALWEGEGGQSLGLTL